MVCACAEHAEHLVLTACIAWPCCMDVLCDCLQHQLRQGVLLLLLLLQNKMLTLTVLLLLLLLLWI